ncbi:hypothetical protein EG329_004306 [Mollisiaceae sp. DMI_Dod_QoI]|nr:hypothetical protein EG329_004306 [Helotiales sp. DMI_Dod_QoI]
MASITSTQMPVWFITGCSTGLGAALATHVLKAGHTVIATARNPSKAESYSSISKLGGHWVALDVTAQNAGETMFEAVKKHGNGKLDVLVNNAGYSILGAVEDIDDVEAHTQLETNFFGPLRLIRASLPLLRAQHSGTIINISSVAGFDGLPTSGLYAASKFALEGLSETLQRELSSFSIRVLVVEPGAFRTRFLSGTSLVQPKAGMGEAYKGTVVEKTLGMFGEMDGKQRGDAEKGVGLIFDVVMKNGVRKEFGEGGWLRLPLGEDCVERYEAKVKGMEGNLEAVRGWVTGLDVDE